jgi:hypothetical protein
METFPLNNLAEKFDDRKLDFRDNPESRHSLCSLACRKVPVGDKVRRGKMLFDDLVGTRQERWRDFDAKRPCGSQVDGEFEFGRLQNW